MAAPCTRNVYIDGGANWCNTLHDYIELAPERRSQAWHTVAFEAMPRIAPHVERCFDALRNGAALPQPPIPPTGSTRDLFSVAATYGCGLAALGYQNSSKLSLRKYVSKGGMLDCMLKKLSNELRSLKPDKHLQSEEVIEERLPILSGSPCSGTTYTFIPAAIGHQSGTLRIWEGDAGLLIGGRTPPQYPSVKRTVKRIDFPSWLNQSVTEEDFVVLKLDVEGAEHAILLEMIRSGIIKKVDVLKWECHFIGGLHRCWRLRDRLKALATLRVVEVGA